MDPSGRWSTRIKGGYSEGFRAPTFNDLFFPGFGSLTLQPPMTLKPETSSEYDGGVEQRLWYERATVEATYFTRRTSDLITAVCDPVTFLCHAANFGLADVQGVETALALRPIRELTLRGTYTYLDFNVLTTAGTQGFLNQRPHNRAAADARYVHDGLLRPGDSIDVNAMATFAGERHDVSGGLDPSYTVVNAAVTYAVPVQARWISRAAVFTRVGNLFDRNYAEVKHFKAPPVNVIAGGQLTF